MPDKEQAIVLDVLVRGGQLYCGYTADYTVECTCGHPQAEHGEHYGSECVTIVPTGVIGSMLDRGWIADAGDKAGPYRYDITPEGREALGIRM